MKMKAAEFEEISDALYAESRKVTWVTTFQNAETILEPVRRYIFPYFWNESFLKRRCIRINMEKCITPCTWNLVLWDVSILHGLPLVHWSRYASIFRHISFRYDRALRNRVNSLFCKLLNVQFSCNNWIFMFLNKASHDHKCFIVFAKYCGPPCVIAVHGPVSAMERSERYTIPYYGFDWLPPDNATQALRWWRSHHST